MQDPRSQGFTGRALAFLSSPLVPLAALLCLGGVGVDAQEAEAQNASAAFTAHVNGYDLREIAVDGDGALWLASSGGVLRFEPGNSTWTTYLHGIGTGPRANDVTTVAIDGAGRVWAGSDGQGYTFYDPATGEWDRDFDEWPDPHITVIRAWGGAVYVGTQEGLLLRPTLNRVDLCSPAAPGCLVPSYDVTDYALLGDTLWVGTRGGLGRFNGTTWDSVSTLPPTSVGSPSLSLAVYGGTLFEVSVSHGVRRLLGSTWEGSALEIDRLRVTDGDLLGLGGRTLYRWTGSTWVDLGLVPPPGITLHDVARVGGEYFLATSRGLLRWDGGGGLDRFLPPGPPLGGVFSGLAVDGTGTVWAATSETDLGLIQFDGAEWVRDDREVPTRWILDLVADPASNIWAGLCCCTTPEDCPLTVIPPPGPTQLTPVLNARAVSGDPAGRLWAGSWRVGVQVLTLQAGAWTPLLELTPESTGGALSSAFLYSIGADGRGTYIGGDNGLDYWPHRGNLASGANGSNWVHIGTGPFGVLDPLVTSIRLVGEDAWVATSGGIHRFRDGILQERCPSRLRGDLGDSPRKVNDVVVDRRGGVWLATDRGILHLPPGSACDGTGGDFVSYTVANSALPDDRVVSAVAHPDGSVWFGAQGGLLRVDPEILSGGPVPEDQFILYPNPLDLTQGNQDVIFGIERAGVRVTPVSPDSLSRPEVYDVAGRLVGRFGEKDEISGPVWFWDGTNLNRSYVAPGLYFVRAQTVGGDVVVLRLGVLR